MDFFFFGGAGRGGNTHPAGGLPLAVSADHAAAVPGGAACLLCRLPILPLACFVAPIPPAPFPAGRGDQRLFHARGFAPCIPSIRPPAALTDPAEAAPCGGACLLCRPLPLPLALLLPPSPRPPSQREGGDYKFISPGATAPGTPALDRLRHLQPLPCRCPAAPLAGNRFLSVLWRTMGSAPGMQGAKPLA